MSFTYDASTDAGKVRLLSIDNVEQYAVFTDAEIQAFLDLNSGSIRFAAASALETMAANKVMRLQKIKTLDLETDGPAVGKALSDMATKLREQESDQGGFEIAETVNDIFGRRQFWRNSWERSEF